MSGNAALNYWRLPHILTAMAALAGLLFPFIVVWSSSVHHNGDFAVFGLWADCWLKDSEKIYFCAEHRPNYPFVGVLASAGALAAIKTLTNADNYTQIVDYFRFYLAAFESLNFLIVWQLANALKLRHGVWISLLITILPSTWAGGALWGQIDVVSQFFLLACVACLVFSIQSEPKSHSLRSSMFFGMGLLALAALLLTKQLAAFSLPVIALLILLACLRLWTSNAKVHVAIAALFAAMAFWILDSRLAVPRGYYGSSFAYVWLGGGSGHSGKISGNGFNIWMFLGRDMWSSSMQPFFCMKRPGQDFCMTPFHTGLALYISYVVALAVLYFSLWWKSLLTAASLFRDEGKIRFVIATLILFLGQINLGFNVFLSGTHERYLYHCFPFLILALFFFYQTRTFLTWRAVLFCVAVASLYGGFVYSIISDLPGYMFMFRSHEFVAAIHLVLLLFLLFFSLRLLHAPILNESDKP